MVEAELEGLIVTQDKVTAEHINEWLINAPRRHGAVRPPVVCRDGFMMSVQASEGHYCFPRDNAGPWVSVEVGFPSRIEPLLWEWAEEKGDWTDTVYPRVPVEVVAAVVELHGGFL